MDSELLSKTLPAVLFAVLILFASLGNLLVCFAIFQDKKLRRQTENIFLISLAISDLLVAVLVMGFAAANDIMGEWPFGPIYCKLWISFDISCCTASILNLCAIAFDRYLHISRPMLYVERMNKRRIVYAVLFVWVLSLALGTVPFLLDRTEAPRHILDVDKEHNSTTCAIKLKPEFAVISSTLSFFLPASLMILAYTKLYLYAREHVKSIRYQIKTAQAALVSQSAQYSSPMVEEHPHILHHKETAVTDNKARVTLGVIMGVFLVCWVPFFLVHIVRSFRPNIIPQRLFLAVTWLGYANSTANPIIYSIFNRDFRLAFGRIIVRWCWCRRGGEHHPNGESLALSNCSTARHHPAGVCLPAGHCYGGVHPPPPSHVSHTAFPRLATCSEASDIHILHLKDEHKQTPDKQRYHTGLTQRNCAVDTVVVMVPS